MIQFPGHTFDFCVSSGALAFDGRGWPWEYPFRWLGLIDPKQFVVVAKTVTLKPRVGNLSMLHPWTCVRTLPGMGTTNAVGLTNPGIHHWLEHDYPRAIRKGCRIAASVKPESPDEAYQIKRLIRSCEMPFVEINMSCPNVPGHASDDMIEMLDQFAGSKHPVVLKLSYDQVSREFIEKVDRYVDGYHAINTVPWNLVYPEKKSPIEGYKHGLKGGVSGPAILDFAVTSVIKLQSWTDRPVIGGGGIFSLEDVDEFHRAGAEAFSIGTCFLHRPWRPNRIVRQWRKIQSRQTAKVQAMID